eukprot:TRINITY_DN564_c0_g1_i1.p1 TRINITY_DN564_c0_g1~~TRINITY_DN564_c0_g1_i1.p1  ORF type:complete len:375 (+),score=130.54 TRINITY_DN564_c0_g1_i1:28-1125(+)
MNRYSLVSLFFFIFVLVNISYCNWDEISRMSHARSDFTADVLNDKIIVVGGCGVNECPDDLDFCICNEVLTSVESYDPENDDWDTLPPLPRQRFRHMSAVIGDRLYVFGGRDVNDNIITDVDYYDEYSGEWFTSESWSTATSDGTAFVVGDTVYLVGGYDSSYNTPTAIYLYNPFTDGPQFTTASTTLNPGRGDMCSSTIHGVTYIAGGFTSDNFNDPLKILQSYDHSSNQWSSLASMDLARGDKACGHVDQQFIVVGGETSDDDESKFHVLLDDVEIYDPSNNDWEFVSDYEYQKFRSAAASYNNRLYVFGGQRDRESVNNVITYKSVRDCFVFTLNGDSSSSASTIVLSFASLLSFALFLIMI